jgi:excisionase family DNA binding protein
MSTSSTMPDINEIGTAEAARLLGVAERTVIRWADNGTLPTVSPPGRARRFHRHAVEGLLQARQAVAS